MKHKMNFNQKLQLVRKSIKNGSEFMGSRWKNSEAEAIALQTICACGLNLEKHGVAISWQGNGTLMRSVDSLMSNHGLVNNPQGVKILLKDNAIVLEPYDNPLNLEIPQDTVLADDGRPMVFKCTEKLLDYAIAFMKLKNL